MGIKNIEMFAYEQWYSGSYADGNGREYDVVFTRNYISAIGYESREVANVLEDGKTIDQDSLWKQVQQSLQEVEDKEFDLLEDGA